MKKDCYKSFAYQFNPLSCMRLTSDIYDSLDKIRQNGEPFWMHFDKASKNLKQQLAKRLSIPKSVRNILFSDDQLPRCMLVNNSIVLVVYGIKTSVDSLFDDTSVIKIWLSDQGLLTICDGEMQSLLDIHRDVETLGNANHYNCLSLLLEYIVYHVEEMMYQLDEQLDKIEEEFDMTQSITSHIMRIRQEIVTLRRFSLSQKVAFARLMKKISMFPDALTHEFHEISTTMNNHVETLSMLRERSIILQDNVTNRIGEVSNQRMYVLTVIMLIFTPAFFIMSLFSMYMPIPGSENKDTWWIITGFIVLISALLLWIFKKKKWL